MFAVCITNAYLDYVNNYLTVAKFASDYGIGEDFASAVIAEGRRLHENNVEVNTDDDGQREEAGGADDCRLLPVPVP